MGDNGDTLKAKVVAKILMTTDGQIFVATKIKSLVQLTKVLSQATFNVIKEVPDGEDKKIVEPKMRVNLPG